MRSDLNVSHQARWWWPCRPAGAESETDQVCHERPSLGNDLHDGDSTALQPEREEKERKRVHKEFNKVKSQDRILYVKLFRFIYITVYFIFTKNITQNKLSLVTLKFGCERISKWSFGAPEQMEGASKCSVPVGDKALTLKFLTCSTQRSLYCDFSVTWQAERE